MKDSGLYLGVAVLRRPSAAVVRSLPWGRALQVLYIYIYIYICIMVSVLVSCICDVRLGLTNSVRNWQDWGRLIRNLDIEAFTRSWEDFHGRT